MIIKAQKIKIDLVTLREDCLWYVDYEDKVALSVFKIRQMP